MEARQCTPSGVCVPSPSPGVTCQSSQQRMCDEPPSSPHYRPYSDSVAAPRRGPSAQKLGPAAALHELPAEDSWSGSGRRRSHQQESWKEPQLADPSCGSEGNPETRSLQAPKPGSQLALAAGTGTGNAGKGVGSHQAERAAVVWRRWRRRAVSGWLILERGARSGFETVQRRIGEEEWIWFCWPP